MPYGVLHSERKEWKRAKEDIIAGIQSGDPAALDALRESYREAVERESEQLFAGFLQALDELGLREQTAIAFVSDHGESWGERYADKSQVKGTYHMHGADLYDEVVRVPLILAAPGRVEPAVDPVAGEPRRPHADAARAGRRADRRPRRNIAAAAPGDRARMTAPRSSSAPTRAPCRSLRCASRRGSSRFTSQSGEEEAYRLDVDPGELVSRPDDVPGELRERLYAELESGLAAGSQRRGGGARRAAPVRSGLSVSRVRSRESWQANRRR